MAVLIARASGAQHGFWVVLGALSVLRSNALATGATALRALAGTIVGFVLGGLLLIAIGSNHAVLWPLLPVVVLIAAFAPDAISFAAGQAAFTIVVIILFNLIAPEGWTIGLLRIEDIAFGCAASVAAGVLFWPRGASAALGRSLADAYRSANDYLAASLQRLTSGASPGDEHDDARAAGWRLDDALRQYLAERGAKHVPLESVTTLVNGATRLRLAGEAVRGLRPDAAGTGSKVTEPLRAPTELLTRQARSVTEWYTALGAVLAGSGDPLPPADPAGTDESFLQVLLPAVHVCGDPDQAQAAEQLLWAGQYIGDVSRLRADLVEPATEIREIRRTPRWAR